MSDLERPRIRLIDVESVTGGFRGRRKVLVAVTGTIGLPQTVQSMALAFRRVQYRSHNRRSHKHFQWSCSA